jgi:uncharacterized protein
VCVVVTIDRRHVSRQIVIKVSNRCNLACDYCYMFEKADQSWRKKPKLISKKTIRRLALRISAYMREHELAELLVDLHGGEPLLAGPELLRYLVTTLRAAVGRTPGQRLRFSMQTNALLLNEQWLALLHELDVKLGVSLDGDEQGNRRRVDRQGTNSYSRVHAALELLQRYEHPLLQRVLCVIDPATDPVATYRHLRQFGPLDLILPHGTWDEPPPGYDPYDDTTPFADWLIRAFDEWYWDEDPADVRLFIKILGLVIEPDTPWWARVEIVGQWVVPAIVVESNGTYEGPDHNKVVREGEAYTGLTVRKNTLTQALINLLETTMDRRLHEPSAACQACPVVQECGGGLSSQRYKAGSYDNVSLYCKDLSKFFLHARARATEAAAASGMTLEEYRIAMRKTIEAAQENSSLPH